MLQLCSVDKTQIKKWVMPMGNKLAASTPTIFHTWMAP